MNTQLLGLELSLVQTRSPRRTGEEGVLRVVYASQDGKKLTVCRFVDPLSEA